MANIKKEYGLSIIFIIFMPVNLIWRSLRSKSNQFKRWALTVFITIYGSTIRLDKANDGYRHLEKVHTTYMDMSVELFFSDILRMLTLRTTESGALDLYKHVVSYLVAVIGFPGLFFTVIAFVYGYFFSGALLAVFRNFNHVVSKNWVFWGFVIMFVLTKNIEGVNTVRTWTGLWVLFYGSIRYYETRRLKYLLLMLSPPLIHFGYFVMLLPVIVVLVFKVRPLLYSVVFVLSSFMNIINPQAAVEQVTKTELGQAKVRGYYQEEQVSTEEKIERNTSEGTNSRWYRTLYLAGIHTWALNLLIYSLIFYKVYPRIMNNIEKHIFSIGLVMLAFSNATWFLSAVSARTSVIANVFILGAFALLLCRGYLNSREYKKKVVLKYMTKISLLGFFPLFVYKVSDILDYPSFFLFFTPFVVWINDAWNLSLKEVLRIITG